MPTRGALPSWPCMHIAKVSSEAAEARHACMHAMQSCISAACFHSFAHALHGPTLLGVSTTASRASFRHLRADDARRGLNPVASSGSSVCRVGFAVSRHMACQGLPGFGAHAATHPLTLAPATLLTPFKFFLGALGGDGAGPAPRTMAGAWDGTLHRLPALHQPPALRALAVVMLHG